MIKKVYESGNEFNIFKIDDQIYGNINGVSYLVDNNNQLIQDMNAKTLTKQVEDLKNENTELRKRIEMEEVEVASTSKPKGIFLLFQ